MSDTIDKDKIKTIADGLVQECDVLETPVKMWSLRIQQGFTPQDKKAPWWMTLDQETGKLAVGGLLLAIDAQRKKLDRLEYMVERIDEELDKGDQETRDTD